LDSVGQPIAARSSGAAPVTGDQALAVVPALAMTGECALSEIVLPEMTPIAGDHPDHVGYTVT